ncbi:phage tail protein [Desulfopila inferna]|uniref:phage tail protein n=1 Tax=Desulfopila inferna TaxID=468528 RepID=UPI001965D419|nr:phage tail protein [Desulfopila inferna]MBM9605975.1 phage tail protein [Desulfopila inferna]
MKVKSIFNRCRAAVFFFCSAVLLVCSSWTNLKEYFTALGGSVKPIGRVHFLFVDEATGAVRDGGWHPNLVTTAGKNHIADQLSGRTQAAMSHMAVGTGTTAALASDTALQTELDRNELDSVVQGTDSDANKITYTCTWAAGDGTGALTEAAIFNSPSAGQMLCRSVYPVKNKETGESMVLTWVLTISS